MIQEVQCRGYKAFDETLALQLRPITIFFGKNNSGKTTLARLPIVIAASFANPETLYALTWRGLHFGSSFMELASADNPHPAVSFGIKWTQRKRISIDLQHIASSSEEQDRVQPTLIRVNNYERQIKLQAQTTTTPRSMVEGVLSDAARRGFVTITDELKNLLGTLVHVPSSRPRITDLYEVRPPAEWTVEEVPWILRSRKQLLSGVNDWFRRHLDGVGVDIDQAAFAFRLVERREDVAINFTQSGRGLQSALPVVSLLLAISSDLIKTPLTIVEEPEAHLHPSAHGDIADLVIKSTAKSQMLVETHSENFLLRIRRRIAERAISHKDVALYFVDEFHRVREIPLDEFGTTTEWPVGVFESDVEEARAIVEAKLSIISERQ